MQPKSLLVKSNSTKRLLVNDYGSQNLQLFRKIKRSTYYRGGLVAGQCCVRVWLSSWGHHCCRVSKIAAQMSFLPHTYIPSETPLEFAPGKQNTHSELRLCAEDKSFLPVLKTRIGERNRASSRFSNYQTQISIPDVMRSYQSGTAAWTTGIISQRHHSAIESYLMPTWPGERTSLSTAGEGECDISQLSNTALPECTGRSCRTSLMYWNWRTYIVGVHHNPWGVRPKWVCRSIQWVLRRVSSGVVRAMVSHRNKTQPERKWVCDCLRMIFFFF